MVVSNEVDSLIATGLILGVVHVLTGPDHLSALATLSASVGSRQAFFLGIRWGIGHSTGLLLVGVVFIILSEEKEDDVIEVPDPVSNFFESLVGVFMLMLGTYGFWSALDRQRLKKAHSSYRAPAVEFARRESENDLQNIMYHHDETHMKLCGSPALTPFYTADPVDLNAPAANEDDDVANVTEGNDMEREQETLQEEEEDIVEDIDAPIPSSSPSCCQWLSQVARGISARTMAFVAGVIHGLAGPGGVLGVVPAVRLHNGKLAALYLGCFCLCSTLTMGVFAATYGTCSAFLGHSDNNNNNNTNNTTTNNNNAHRRAFWIDCFSASLSILVGITWLTLIYLDKLDDVFP